MKEKIKDILNKAWNEPRRFFFWLTVFSVAVPLVGIFVDSHTPGFSPSSALQSLAFNCMAGLAVGIIVGLLGFVLSWIPPFRQFMERMLRRRFFILACGITLIALFYAEENWRGKRTWENYRRTWEAKGEKFDRQDFTPAPVPDDQNFAMTPFLTPLLEFKPGTQEHPTTNWNWQFEDLKQKIGGLDLKTSEQERSNSWGKSQGNLTEWYATFLRDRRLNVNEPTPTNGTPHELATKVLEALSPADSVLDEIRAASRRPHARFNIRYENDDPAAILLPHLAVLKHLTLVLQLRASAELTLGHTDDAANDINLMFYLAEAIRTEPILISQLVRFVQIQLALQPIAQGLEAHQWSEPQLLAFQQRLEAFNLSADCKHAMNAERALFGGGILDYFRNLNSCERARFLEAICQWPESPRTYFPWLFHAGVMPTGWYYLEQLNYDQSYQSHLLPIIDVQNRRISPSLAHKADEKLGTRLPLKDALLGHQLFSAILLPALPTIAEKTARAQTAADMAAIACALERYHRVNAKYPPSLDALVSQFMAKLPNDVISGQLPRYRLAEDNQFALYSVGWNEKDDGGTIAFSKENKGLDWKEGDWVWRSAGK